MLGTAIPRRWIFSVALVGLVTIFAVAYSAVWSPVASAHPDDTEGSAGTGNSTLAEKTDEQTLTSASTLPEGLTLTPGEQIHVSVDLIDGTDSINNELDSSVTYSWSTVVSGINVVAGASARTAILEANSSGKVKVEITQVRKNETWKVTRFIEITVVAAPVPEPSDPLPTNPPGPVPSDIPNADGVAAPESSLNLSQNGSSFQMPVGSLNVFAGVRLDSVSVSSLPSPPSGFELGSAAVDVVFVDTGGNDLSNFSLLRAGTVCLDTAPGDLVNGFDRVKLLKYNSGPQPVVLSSTYNILTGQVCASSTTYSVFAIGVQQAVTPPDGGGLPATGGWSPTNSILILAGLLGVALIGGGAFTLRRAKITSRPD